MITTVVLGGKDESLPRKFGVPRASSDGINIDATTSYSGHGIELHHDVEYRVIIIA